MFDFWVDLSSNHYHFSLSMNRKCLRKEIVIFHLNEYFRQITQFQSTFSTIFSVNSKMSRQNHSPFTMTISFVKSHESNIKEEHTIFRQMTETARLYKNDFFFLSHHLVRYLGNAKFLHAICRQ